jgi:methyltransferase (TIGR00027 family)
MAAARAIGSLVYEAEGILEDPFAPAFLGPRFSALHRVLRLAPARVRLGVASLYDRILPGSVGWVLTRHRYFDDAVDDAVKGGAKQVVIVGAGYDSRALRQKGLAAVRVFEVDHPDTQARKMALVRRALGRLPTNVEYVSLNATRGDLARLPEHGFDVRQPSVFVLEGFLWYMPPDVARAILRAIVAVVAPGSLVIFDYILPSVVQGTCTLEGARRHARYCARRGEPILSGIEPDELAGQLGEVGLRLLEDVGHEALTARYTRGSRREIKVYPFLRIAKAVVPVRS